MSVPAGPSVRLSPEALDRLMPLHLRVSASGHIRHVGPTLARLGPEAPATGRPLLDCFEFRRPRGVAAVADLAAAAGEKLSLRLRAGRRTAFKGIAVPAGEGELLVNLSFGIGSVQAVGDHGLTGADFPPTDLTVEMLYLAEAKEAVLEESRKLNRRLQGARIAAEEQAFTDTLTGLKNRRAMEHILSRYAAAEQSFALMHVDLDWFKAVNDTHGHAAGDHVLQVVARILVDETRREDTAVRLGGDEFVLIFPRLVRPARLSAVARRVLSRLDRPIPFGGALCRVSASIGIAVSEGPDRPEPAAVLRAADTALYRSKRAGRGRYGFAGPLEPPAAQELPPG